MTLTHAVLAIIIPGAVLIALAVDVAAMVAWMRNRR